MSMEDGEAVASEVEGRTTGIVRLSEIELPTRLGEKYDFLGIVDTLLQQASFHIKISRMKWGANEASVLLLASASIILGSWDFGIGELAGGGDWGRSGILGEDSGFLHLNEWTRMLSLLSVMAWVS